jgi:hydrogenase nickel incorporation protein HypA/HybF
MHELAISRNVVAIVEEAAKGRRVRRVDLDIGRLSGVLPDAIAFCFDVVAKGTTVEGARLEIREIEGRARCLSCESEFDTPSLLSACACGSRRLRRLRGEELSVRSIETEEVEGAV